MLDIFEDSCEGLELDRIKDKIRAIWQQIVVAEYNNEYGQMKDDNEDYKTLDEYLTENQLYFPGDDKPEDETSAIVKMLEEMFDDKEELDPVTSEGRAPTYEGSELKANNEKGTIEATSYDVKFAKTVTPKDTKTSVKSGTYEGAKSGKLSRRKDSEVKRSYSPMVKKLVEELLDLDKRQGIGRRKQLFRL